MRKRIKEWSRIAGLSQWAASYQEKRRDFLRSQEAYDTSFEVAKGIGFVVDKGARKPFAMFTGKHREMTQEMELFIALAKDKECLLDIGSLFGVFSLTFCAINPDGEAFAIEPSPKSFKVLDRHCHLNPRQKIRAFQKAFGENSGKLDMHYEWVHLIANHPNDQDKTVEVEMTSIDEFVLDNHIQPDILKIDVDGYEGPVIAGAQRFLRKNNPIIFLELHGNWISRYGYTPLSIAESLSNLGYQFYTHELQPVEDVRASFELFANRLICVKDYSQISYIDANKLGL